MVSGRLSSATYVARVTSVAGDQKTPEEATTRIRCHGSDQALDLDHSQDRDITKPAASTTPVYCGNTQAKT